jgi:3',5'-cyclic AMP phosphodiesterase CpdA
MKLFWEDGLRIIHLSDLHIGKSNNLEKCTRIADWILENQETHRSGVVIISGDLVDDGQNWQFKQAKDFVERLLSNRYSVLVAPGNHDYGPNGIRESTESQSDFRDLISGIEEYPALFFLKGQAIILLDSMAEEMKTMEFWGAQGYLGAEQLAKLDRLLDDLAGNPAIENVVLTMHHHPFDYLFYHALRDHVDLKGVISRRIDAPPRVNALIFGHKHTEHRFNDPDDNKEELYGIDLIYASGQTVERNNEGKMILPVLDLKNKTIERYLID